MFMCRHALPYNCHGLDSRMSVSPHLAQCLVKARLNMCRVQSASGLAPRFQRLKSRPCNSIPKACRLRKSGGEGVGSVVLVSAASRSYAVAACQPFHAQTSQLVFESLTWHHCVVSWRRRRYIRKCSTLQLESHT